MVKSRKGVPLVGKIGFSVIIGAVLATAMHRLLRETVGTQIIYEEDNWKINSRDIIVLVAGFLLIAFGGKISSTLRWIGVGMVAWQVGQELLPVFWNM